MKPYILQNKTNVIRQKHRDLTLSLPGVINFKFPPQPHWKYYIAQYEELGFSYLTQTKDDYTTNSHYLTYTFLFQQLGECTFELLGVKV